MQPHWLRPHLLQVENVLTADECEALLLAATSLGFETQVYRPPLIPEARQRAMGMFEAWATLLTSRLLPCCPAPAIWFDHWSETSPPDLKNWEIMRVNERFRFYRYGPNEQFAPHRDHPYCKTAREQTFLSVIIYLNEGFLGGETRFADLAVQPQQGACLIYPHELMHEGGIVLAGIKTILRTDIFFQKAVQ